MALQQYTPAKQSENFEAGLRSLPAEFGDGEAYFDFLDTFGTHYVTSMAFGSRFGFTSFFTEEAWHKVQKTGVQVDVAASYEGLVKAGGSVDTSSKKQAQQAFDESQQGYKMISLGAQPVRGDPIAWAQQVVEEPMPVTYELSRLCDVIYDGMWAQKKNCYYALSKEQYCTKRVMARGDVGSCADAIDGNCAFDLDCQGGEECVFGACRAAPRW